MHRRDNSQLIALPLKAGCTLALALLSLPTAAFAQTGAKAPAQSAPTLFPFVIPWDDSTVGTANDVSFLNTIPAGAGGYIVVKNGHFIESTAGKRVRFLGTNFTFLSSFPDHADADKIAAHLAKLGINLVRIHHHDDNRSLLWDKTVKGHTKFDPASVDKLDYLIAQFKKHGIYVDLNLHVGRTFTPDDGFPASVAELANYDKRIDNLDRHMIELQ